jgi:hypothetical protein
MAEISYIFGDILTGTVIEEIPLQGVSMTRGFGQGDFRGTFQLDQTGKNNKDLIEATREGRCFVVCEREGQPIWDGFIWTNTYQSQSKTHQLYCKSFEHYPEYRFLREDISYVDIEQRNIFTSLWTLMLSQSNSPQITIPSSFSDVVLKSIISKSFEFKTYRSLMDIVANGDNGFDWTIDTTKVGGSYVRTLRIGYPTLGAIEYTDIDNPGAILNYWKNASMAGKGTHVFGIGAGEGSTMLIQPVEHTDLISSGFPRYDTAFSMKEVNNSDLLEALTTQLAIVRKPTKSALTIEVKGDQEPIFGSFGLGDAARLHLNDPEHPEPIDQLFLTRILGWEYYPSSDDHVEYSRIVFDGEVT